MKETDGVAEVLGNLECLQNLSALFLPWLSQGIASVGYFSAAFLLNRFLHIFL